MAQLHIGLLARQRTRNNVLSALEKLPDGLNDVYDAVMNRIRSQSTDDASLALKILSWITYAKVPLKSTVLQHAVAVTEYTKDISDDDLIDVEDLVSVCVGIVTVDSESGIIRLVHYTTQTYLQSYLQSQFPTANVDIAMTCLVYLGFDVFNNPCRNKTELEERLTKYNLYTYAALYLGEHACGDTERHIMNRFFETFQTQGKRDSVGQTVIYYSAWWHPFVRRTNRLLLHIVSGIGLSTICSTLLSGLMKNDTWLFSLVES